MFTVKNLYENMRSFIEGADKSAALPHAFSINITIMENRLLVPLTDVSVTL
jgi:sulfite reductase beta subunit-like hemoprotein